MDLKKEQDPKLEAYYYGPLAHFAKHICASTENMILRTGSGDLPETQNEPACSELWHNLLEKNEKQLDYYVPKVLFSNNTSFLLLVPCERMFPEFYSQGKETMLPRGVRLTPKSPFLAL